MSWEFEHWDGGKVYLHTERWAYFRRRFEDGDLGYRHAWNRERIFVSLHTPRDRLIDVPAPGDPGYSHKISHTEEWGGFHPPYPAFFRSVSDPEGWLPSWNLWAEPKTAKSEPLHLLHTDGIYAPPPPKDGSNNIYISFTVKPCNLFAHYRGQFWMVQESKRYGLGKWEPEKPPPRPQKGRSVYDSFDPDW